jgi:probable F420-dependent oxidoreductase
MNIGVSAYLQWYGPAMSLVAKTAEDLGFESIWKGEHIVIPVDIAKPIRHGTPLPDDYKHMPDPFIWMTAAATATTRLKLGFDICLVSQRNPLVLAKEVASLDLVSNGRVILGIGSGWIEEEAKIMGYPFAARWPKTMEHVRALKTLWTEDEPSFEGEFVSFPPVYSYPKPVQKPHPPILIGAGNHNTDNAKVLGRVAELGDGWVPAFLSPAQMKDQLALLDELCRERGRDAHTMDITLLVPGNNLSLGERPAFFANQQETPKDPHELIAEYEAAGVTRIIVGLPAIKEPSDLKHMEDAANRLGLV